MASPVCYDNRWGIAVLYFSIITLFSLAFNSQAQILSEQALFNRCYSQITNTRPKKIDPLNQAVKSGQKKAITACLEVLAKANFNSSNNETISDINDPVAKNVLSTFHHLHSTWFYNKDFSTISWPGFAKDSQDLYDSSSPAFYMTRALFKPTALAKDILNSNENLVAVRTNMTPAAGPDSSHPLSDFIFSGFNFAATGDLLGIKVQSSVIVSTPKNTNIDLYQTLGGGYLGTTPYLLLNVGTINSGLGHLGYKTNGALQTHRKWGKAFFKDTLCRELPVVREEDVVGMVDPKSSVPFRTSTSCTRCHASHDRVSGVVRGLTIAYADIGNGDPTGLGQKKRGGNFPKFHPVVMAAETGWPAVADADYYRRPQNGVLYFRDYQGNLIDQTVTGVQDLASKVTELDDFYICLAKRYYSYFTGIDVDTGDIKDPTRSSVLTSQDERHRDTVISLGKKFKTHQNIQKLISDILNLDQYKKTDFGIKDGI